jgi:hypothetical protein
MDNVGQSTHAAFALAGVSTCFTPLGTAATTPSWTWLWNVGPIVSSVSSFDARQFSTRGCNLV